MTKEEALKLIEETKVNYQQKQHIARGLNILAKYDDNMQMSFEHDQMWAADFDSTTAKMTREDVIELAACGWFEDTESWSHF